MKLCVLGLEEADSNLALGKAEFPSSFSPLLSYLISSEAGNLTSRCTGQVTALCKTSSLSRLPTYLQSQSVHQEAGELGVRKGPGHLEVRSTQAQAKGLQIESTPQMLPATTSRVATPGEADE